ncbi:phage head-tail connector protein [Sediminibacillus massiliensis]|uniref:phage head-tail connector protein n=1 Tax=Sediminibacillus massiliensis TaxID=1926277 RepID=UPI0009886724|nr:hypothetical protein [Sediminibacillus massiliensis]
MVTVSQVQSSLGLKNKEEQIAELIPVVENHIKGYCGIKEIPPEYELNLIKMIEFQLNSKAGITSESLSRHSVGYADNYPSNVLRGLRRRLRW